MVITATGDVSDFDALALATLKMKLLEIFADAEDVLLSVAAASVLISSQLVMVSASAASNTASTLQNTLLTSSLGINITNVSSPVISIQAFSAPPLPPGLPPQPPLWPPPPPLPPPCAEGTYSDYAGDGSCKPCPAGFYCKATVRLPCPAGTVGALTNLKSSEGCVPVAPGFYAPMGSSTSFECPIDGSTFVCPGAAADNRDGIVPGSTPIVIGPGAAANAEGVQTCPAGLQSALLAAGGFTCTACLTGHYCLGGQPIPCPSGKWHNAEADRLVPKQSNESSCTECPEVGVQCLGIGDQLLVKPGYWMESSNASVAYPCPWQSACPGDRAVPGTAGPFADASCAAGYSGALCGRCTSGYYRGRRKCLACSEYDSDSRLSGGESTTILVPLISLLLFCIAIYLEPPARLQECLSRCISVVARSSVGRRVPQFLSICSALTKICLGYAQCLGAISRFPRVRWPRIFVAFMAELDALNLELFSIYPVECLAGRRLGFYWELLATTSMPIIAAATAFMLVLSSRWAAGRFYFFPRSPRRCPTWMAWRLQDDTPGWKGLMRSWNQPRMYKLLTWVSLIMYPSLARKLLAIFDCVPAGNGLLLLRDDPVLPEGRCQTAEWNRWIILASCGLGLFCLGMPAAALYLSGRYHFSGNIDDVEERGRVTLLVSSYQDKYWFAESLSLMHRFVFTGVIHLAWPESRVQLWAGSGLSVFVFVVFMLTLPYRHAICDWVQAAAFLQLLFTYLSSFLFFDDGGEEVIDDSLGTVLVIVNCGCFVVMVLGAGISIWRARRISSARRLRYGKGKGAAVPRVLVPPLQYHLFLSHVWGTGQDQARITKQRLVDALPGLQVFLDVDEPDLEIGDLEGYIDRSDTVLVLATRGYFESKNCMRELRRAVMAEKQLICMLEPEAAKGGLTLTEIRELLKAEPLLYEALLEHEPIEWNRIGVFQNITIRLIAQRLLPIMPAAENAHPVASAMARHTTTATVTKGGASRKSSLFDAVRASSALDTLSSVSHGQPSDPGGTESSTAQQHSGRLSMSHPVSRETTFIKEEQQQRKTGKPPKPKTGKHFHLFVSEHNPGAMLLIDEVRSSLGESSVLSSQQAPSRRSLAQRLASRRASKADSSVSQRRSSRGNDAAVRESSTGSHGVTPEETPDSSTTVVSFGDEERSQGKLKQMEPRRSAFFSRSVSFMDDGFEASSMDRPGRHSSRRLSLQKSSSTMTPKQPRLSRQPSHRSALTTSMRDVLLRANSEVTISNQPRQLCECEAMLVYLNQLTWSSDKASVELGRQIARALAEGIPLLLAHEMPGLSEDDGRHGCEFALFFKPGQTPQALLDAGIYHTVAVPLKHGDYRSMSVALLTRKLIDISRALPPNPQNLRTVKKTVRDLITQGSVHEALHHTAKGQGEPEGTEEGTEEPLERPPPPMIEPPDRSHAAIPREPSERPLSMVIGPPERPLAMLAPRRFPPPAQIQADDHLQCSRIVPISIDSDTPAQAIASNTLTLPPPELVEDSKLVQLDANSSYALNPLNSEQASATVYSV